MFTISMIGDCGFTHTRASLAKQRNFYHWRELGSKQAHHVTPVYRLASALPEKECLSFTFKTVSIVCACSFSLAILSAFIDHYNNNNNNYNHN